VEDVEKLKPLCTAGGNVKWFGIVRQLLKEINIKLSSNLISNYTPKTI
jgi:hypothetical protein